MSRSQEIPKPSREFRRFCRHVYGWWKGPIMARLIAKQARERYRPDDGA